MEPEARVSVYNKSGPELMTRRCGEGVRGRELSEAWQAALVSLHEGAQAFLGAALLVFPPSHSAALRSASLASHWHVPLLALPRTRGTVLTALLTLPQ